MCLVRSKLSRGGARARTDVLVASPERRYRATSTPLLIKTAGSANYVQIMGLGVSGTAVSRSLCLCVWLSAESCAEQGQ